MIQMLRLPTGELNNREGAQKLVHCDSSNKIQRECGLPADAPTRDQDGTVFVDRIKCGQRA